MKQTAVEFLESQYNFHGELKQTDFEQAKEMEMEQTIGFGDEYEYYFLCGGKATMEQYYKENFKSTQVPLVEKAKSE